MDFCWNRFYFNSMRPFPTVNGNRYWWNKINSKWIKLKMFVLEALHILRVYLCTHLYISGETILYPCRQNTRKHISAIFSDTSCKLHTFHYFCVHNTLTAKSHLTFETLFNDVKDKCFEISKDQCFVA